MLPPFDAGESTKHEWELQMNRVYVLSDRFEALDLKRVALKLLTETLLSPSNQHAPYVEATKVAFENLPDGDPLLRLLVEVHCEKYKYMDEKNAEMEAQGLPHDFLVCVMMRYSKIRVGTGQLQLDVKDYQLGSGTRS